MGVNWVPPIPPRLEMVKPASLISSGFNNPSLALAEVSVNSSASSINDFLPTSRTTGTTKPLGVSTAIPRLKYFLITRFTPFSSSEALKFG